MGGTNEAAINMALQDITDEVPDITNEAAINRALRDISHIIDEVPHDIRSTNRDFMPYDSDDEDYERENHPVYRATNLLPNDDQYDDDDDAEEEITTENSAVGPPHFVLEEFIFRSLQLLHPTATQDELEGFMQEIFSGAREDDQEEEEELAGVIRERNSDLSEEIIYQNLKSRTCQEEDLQEICVVCQCEYEELEEIGRLQCGHEYHANCIKTWLMKNNSCPVCKSKAIPSQI